VACLVFSFIGLALGVPTRRDGKLASFALGIGVIFAYYILWFGGQGLARSAVVSPHWAVWICNIVLGAFGVALLAWRARFGEHQLLPALPRWRRRPPPAGSDDAAAVSGDAEPGRGVSLGGGGIGWGVSLLDRYVAKQYLKLVVLSFVGLLGIFYIVTFLEIYDRLLRGDATLGMVLEYFWYATPQWVYYVLPISALVATLVTVGLFTKTSELTVMKACGISLYRVALPLFLFAMLWGGTLFGMSESFLADANRRAGELNRVIRGGSPEYVDILQRRWLMGEDGTIYNYGHFDPIAVTLDRVTAYKFAEDQWRLAERVFAGTAVHEAEWQGRGVWAREFGDDRSPGPFETSAQLPLQLASPESFATERPDAERMNYRELDRYIAALSASGEDVVPLRVELQRKLSFPFVTLILTLIAVPFAVTMGRHGALSGVGIGIVLALSYWVVISIFAAIGSAGIVTPLLAAWAPNVLFGGSAAYLLLAART
jgi:LPS export ABC transporter permease LptG